jgi:hypothetical protein
MYFAMMLLVAAAGFVIFAYAPVAAATAEFAGRH